VALTLAPTPAHYRPMPTTTGSDPHTKPDRGPDPDPDPAPCAKCRQLPALTPTPDVTSRQAAGARLRRRAAPDDAVGVAVEDGSLAARTHHAVVVCCARQLRPQRGYPLRTNSDSFFKFNIFYNSVSSNV